VSLHAAGVLGLLLAFVLSAWRPVNLGVLCLAATFVVGWLLAGEGVAQMLGGFPVDLFVLLTGVTYLFAVASENGTVDRLVRAGAGMLRRRGLSLAWGAFALAAVPALLGSLGSAGVALLAPLLLRLARVQGVDPRLVGLMTAHGAAAGNFSPLNPLGVLVQQTAVRGGHAVSAAFLFGANVAYNVALAGVVYLWFGRSRIAPAADARVEEAAPEGDASFGREQIATLAALLAVAVAALAFGVNAGVSALVAAVLLQLLFPRRLKDAGVAWAVVLLVCGVVTYVSALQRYGTLGAAGAAIASLGSPQLAALAVCALAAVTSAFASSAGVLAVVAPLLTPLLAGGRVDAAGLIVAVAISATVVDAAPFSTVGALVVASADATEQPRLYRSLLLWGAAMAVTAPPLTWLLFVAPAAAATGGP
jgi:di/tricarboxylate transporter